jgi:hypothetical protein
MQERIEGLEQDKLDLEARNAQTIEANRDLLDQLEHMNATITDSDAHIQALTDTLRSTEEELDRLGALAAQTQLLELQLIELEREQSQLQSNIDAKTVDERTAMQRWKNAERTIGDLQHQIVRIEREARDERARHVEVVARMERRMAVEGELNTAAGRPRQGRRAPTSSRTSLRTSCSTTPTSSTASSNCARCWATLTRRWSACATSSKSTSQSPRRLKTRQPQRCRRSSRWRQRRRQRQRL